MVQSLLVKLQADVSWLSHPGLRDAVPFVVIILAMVFRGRALAPRDTPLGLRLPVAPAPASRGAIAPAATAVVATAIALFLLGPELRLALVQSLIGAVICLSLVLLTGYLGQISLAQMAFAGVAGFALARLAGDAGIPFPLAPLLAAAVAGVLGLAVGVPALRVRGISLAVVTLAGAVAVEEMVFKSPAVTGGVGGTTVPEPRLFALDLGIGGSGGTSYPRPVFGLVVLAVVAGLAVGVRRLRGTAWGRRLLAVRANERAAAATGVDVAATKLVGFAASAFVAGLGGALLAYAQGRLSFASFGVFVSLSYLAVAYVGGITRVSGALVGGALVSGGIVFTAVDRFADLGRYQLLATGLALVAMAVAYPAGVADAGARLLRRRSVTQ
jgi:branched-chain amino acid transport system permease protein